MFGYRRTLSRPFHPNLQTFALNSDHVADPGDQAMKPSRPESTQKSYNAVTIPALIPIVYQHLQVNKRTTSSKVLECPTTYPPPSQQPIFPISNQPSYPFIPTNQASQDKAPREDGESRQIARKHAQGTRTEER